MRVTLLLGVTCSLLGLSVFGATMAAPERTEAVAGGAKVAVEREVRRLLAPDLLPEIALGGEGGDSDLDRCTGEFTEMIGYRLPGVLPLFAAHNVCGGDVLLGWEIGQRVRVAGEPKVYEVVEERITAKPAVVETLRGMSGEFMVQTCFYGQARMRFLSLAPVAQAP